MMKTMKKSVHNRAVQRISLAFVLMFGLLCSLGMQAFAADYPLVNDEAALLTESEVTALQQKAEEYSEAWQQDIAIYTTNSIGDQTISAAADDYFDDNGFGRGGDDSGVVFVLDMGGRNYWFSTYARTAQALTDYGIKYIGDAMVEDLSAGNYADAFDIYLEEVNRFLEQDANGAAYDTNNTAEPTDYMKCLGIGAAVGFGAAALFCLVFVMQLRTARRQHSASEYLTGRGFALTNQRDLYLYSNTSRHRKPEQSSSSGGGSSMHTSSSGRSHGGGGGSF